MSYRGSASSLSALPLSSAAALAKAPTALEQLLEEIQFQRTKEMRQMLKDGKPYCSLNRAILFFHPLIMSLEIPTDSGFVMVHGTTYWTDLFVRHFLFQTDRNIDCDDLLFFVRKKHIKSSSRILPKFEVSVCQILENKKLNVGVYYFVICILCFRLKLMCSEKQAENYPLEIRIWTGRRQFT